MKKATLITVLAAALFALSCKKDAPADALRSYLKFKMDGTQIECNDYIKARSTSADGITQMLTLNGSLAEVSIELTLYEDHHLTPGQYIFAADKFRRGMIWVNQAIHYAGDEGFYNSLSGSGKITITEINKEFVKGAFGFITGEDYITHLSKNITDGEFSIKIE